MQGTFDLVIAGDGINIGQITHERVHRDVPFSDANNQSDISAKNNKKENTLTYGSYVKKRNMLQSDFCFS